MVSSSDHKTALKQFLASIATIKGDLSNITAPPFLLAPKSAVEFPAAWCEYPSLLVAPASEPDPEKRALLVLRWYLAALKAQQHHTGNDEDGVKKPLNSFLGELFLAEWDVDGGKTQLVSEQVCHHPPVTACALWNTTHGVRAHGYTRQEISFTGSVHIKQIGHATLHLDKYDEDYVQTLPAISVKSLLTGSPYPELEGPVYIYSSTGYTSKIEFESGTHLLGLVAKKDRTSVHATLYPSNDPETPLYQVSGEWSGGGDLEFKDLRDNTLLANLDTHSLVPHPMTVRPLQDQDPWESRRAWAGVLTALKDGDMSAVAREKSRIEEAQREMRRQEQREERVWEPRFFNREEADEVFERVAGRWGEEVRKDLTDGVWRFDQGRFEQAQRPFRAEITPLGKAGEERVVNGA